MPIGPEGTRGEAQRVGAELICGRGALFTLSVGPVGTKLSRAARASTSRR